MTMPVNKVLLTLLVALWSGGALAGAAQQAAKPAPAPAIMNKGLPCTLAGSHSAADTIEQAVTCVREGRMMDATRLYQAGLLRLRILADMEKTGGPKRSLLAEYQKRVGPVILNWAGGDVRDLIESIEWAMKFDKTVPDDEIQAYARERKVSESVLKGIRADQYSTMMASRKKIAMEMEEMYDKRNKNGTGVRDVVWRARRNMKPEGFETE